MKWLSRLTYLYLLLPFILFVLGWFRLFIALPLAMLMVWVLWRLWTPKSPDFGDNQIKQNREILHSFIPAIIMTGLWIVLSGVGGYAFQNWDHHWRNAVFRDLITFDWPVYYAQPEQGPIKMLVYYVGYWLPAAWTGKLLGWKFANFILFLWTWLGVLLVVSHLSFRLKTSSLKTALLLIFFSGMDALGALFFASEYPTLWPPIQHLEIWGKSLQYSSFTTQLFWVFNQAVPAWLCVSVFITLSERALSEVEVSPRPKNLNQQERDSSIAALAQKGMLGQLALIWALCFFFAPLISIGLLPYLLIEWFEHLRTKLKSPLTGIRFDLLLAASVALVVSYLFFSSNTAAQERGFQAIALTDVIVFFLLEGGILWMLFAPRLWRDPRWWVTGVLLIVIPFMQLGSDRDFVMRASIAPLFYLMVWTGETIFQNIGSRFYRIGIAVILMIGMLAPLYEINRSAYRTFEYYFLLDKDQRMQPSAEPATHLEQAGAPEAEHLGMLVADNIQTLRRMDDLLSKNFVANVRQSLYYRYVAPH